VIPEFGRYAGTVLGAYAVTVGLLAALIAASWWQARAVRRRLAALEARMGRSPDGR